MMRQMLQEKQKEWLRQPAIVEALRLDQAWCLLSMQVRMQVRNWYQW
jgi:hypothetical protein